RGILGVAAEVAGEEHGVDLAGAEESLRHAVEAPEVLLPAAGEVDRIARRRRRRERVGHPRRELVGQRRQLEAIAGGDVRGYDAVTATVAADRDASSARPRRGERRLRDVDQLRGRAYTDDAGRAAGRLDGRSAADKSAGMRERGARAGGARPR